MELFGSLKINPYICSRIARESLSTTFWIKLERYACLTVVKPRKLSQINADDSVISFHVWRGLLLLYLAFWVFLGPSTEDVEHISATLQHITNLNRLPRCWEAERDVYEDISESVLS